jgi:SAM-dependent methyltransferase
MPEDYEYRGLMAQAWDLLRGDTSGWPDRAFYRSFIEQRGGAALDVGCGTGRLLLDYLQAGLDVDGVDNSPEMLAIPHGGLWSREDGELVCKQHDRPVSWHQ